MYTYMFETTQFYIFYKHIKQHLARSASNLLVLYTCEDYDILIYLMYNQSKYIFYIFMHLFLSMSLFAAIRCFWCADPKKRRIKLNICR